MHISGQKFIYPHFLIPKLNGVVHKIVRRVTLMVCGGMFGVWSRVDGVGNKFYIIKKIMGYNMSYRIAYVPPS